LFPAAGATCMDSPWAGGGPSGVMSGGSTLGFSLLATAALPPEMPGAHGLEPGLVYRQTCH
jgi:hypothetical protein